MIARPRTFVVLLGAVAAAAAGVVLQHGRGATGRGVPGGILIRDAALYDTLSHRLLLGSLFGRIAADIAAVAPDGGHVLEVGCGPGRLSILMARRHDLGVTGLDLDPAMIERALRNADSPEEATGDGRRSSSATSPHWRSPTDRSTWWSARCRCTTGPTRRRVWPR